MAGGDCKKQEHRLNDEPVFGNAGRRLRLIKGTAASEIADTGLVQEMLAYMVSSVIGRRVVLHDLLVSADFAKCGLEKGSARPVWRYRHHPNGPFRILLGPHILETNTPYLTIVSKGHLEIKSGHRLPVVMELLVERIGVSPMGAAMQWAETNQPLVLGFKTGPAVFNEIAFSFDIGEKKQKNNPVGCGFLAFPGWDD